MSTSQTSKYLAQYPSRPSRIIESFKLKEYHKFE
jgi:hypothetical protein